MTKSTNSRGNPYHDEEGKFCSASEMGKAVQRLRDNGDIFGWVKLRAEYEVLLNKDDEVDASKIASLLGKPALSSLESFAPAEIDMELSSIWNKMYSVEDQIKQTEKYIKDYKTYLDPNSRHYESREYGRVEKAKTLADLEEKKSKLEAQLSEIRATTKPFTEEFDRRGGWTRLFLVTNTGGHAHNTMGCSTCYPSTRYAWLPEYSGKNETEIVSDAGSKACTVCFPTAPVDVLNRPTKLELPDKREARLAREKASAEREAKRLATGITTRDGRPLYVKSYNGVIKTARTAEIQAVNIWKTVREIQDQRYPRTEDAVWIAEVNSEFDLLVDALASKNGISEEEQRKLLVDKGDKKYEKDYKGYPPQAPYWK